MGIDRRAWLSPSIPRSVRPLSFSLSASRVELGHELTVLYERLDTLRRGQTEHGLDHGFTGVLREPGSGGGRVNLLSGYKGTSFLGDAARLQRNWQTCPHRNSNQKLDRQIRNMAMHDLAQRRLGHTETLGRGELIYAQTLSAPRDLERHVSAQGLNGSDIGR